MRTIRFKNFAFCIGHHDADRYRLENRVQARMPCFSFPRGAQGFVLTQAQRLLGTLLLGDFARDVINAQQCTIVVKNWRVNCIPKSFDKYIVPVLVLCTNRVTLRQHRLWLARSNGLCQRRPQRLDASIEWVVRVRGECLEQVLSHQLLARVVDVAKESVVNVKDDRVVTRRQDIRTDRRVQEKRVIKGSIQRWASGRR